MTAIRALFFKVLLFSFFSGGCFAANYLEPSGDITYSSNVMSRGISQSGDKASFQGNLNWQQNEGVHFGIYASQVDFKFNPSTKETFEFNYKIGYKERLENFDIDYGLVHHHFPGVAANVDFDFQEVYIDFLKETDDYKIGNSFFISDNNFNQSGKSLYYNLYANYNLDDRWILNLSYGYQEVEKDLPYGSSDYSDWLVGLDYKLKKNILLKVYYTGNDIEDSFCNEVCGETVTSSISYIY